MKQSVKTVLNVFILSAGMLALVSPAYAQEGSSTAPAAPAGVGILILLMGLAAIAIVAFAQFAQSRAARMPEENLEDE